MSTIVIAIGAPASGKTTKYHEDFPTFEHLSQDEIRFAEYDYEHTGKDFDADDEPRIQALFLRKFKDAMAEGKDIYIDNTNLTTKKRVELLLMIYPAYSVILIEFKVPLEDCLKRNAARDRVVPAHKLKQLYAGIQWIRHVEWQLWQDSFPQCERRMIC